MRLLTIWRWEACFFKFKVNKVKPIYQNEFEPGQLLYLMKWNFLQYPFHHLAKEIWALLLQILDVSKQKGNVSPGSFRLQKTYSLAAAAIRKWANTLMIDQSLSLGCYNGCSYFPFSVEFGTYFLLLSNLIYFWTLEINSREMSLTNCHWGYWSSFSFLLAAEMQNHRMPKQNLSEAG